MIEDYALPPQTFDRLEIEAITVGPGEMRQMGDPDLTRAAGAVRAEIAAILSDDREQHLPHSISRVYRPNGHYGSPPHLQAIRQACWEEQEIEIGSRDQSDAASLRIMRPLAIMYSDHVLTVLASVACAMPSGCFGATGSRGFQTTQQASVLGGQVCCAITLPRSG